MGQGQLPVARPAVFRQGQESFARVVIGPFDRNEIPTLDVKIRSLELDGDPEDSKSRPRRPILYGKQVVLGGESAAPLQRKLDYRPPSIRVRAIRNIPRFRPSGRPWDAVNGSAPDLRLVLFVGQEERGRTKVFDEATGSLSLDHFFRLDEDSIEARVVLKVWDVDIMSSEEIDQMVWNPGQLRSGSITKSTDGGLTVDLEIVAPEIEKVIWDPEPFYILQ